MNKIYYKIIGFFILMIVATYPWWSLVLFDFYILQPHKQTLDYPIQEIPFTAMDDTSFFKQEQLGSYSYVVPDRFTLTDEAAELGLYSRTYKSENKETLAVVIDNNLQEEPVPLHECPQHPQQTYSLKYTDFTPWTLRPFTMRDFGKKLMTKATSFPVILEQEVRTYRDTLYSISAGGGVTGETFAFLGDGNYLIERIDCGSSILIVSDSYEDPMIIDQMALRMKHNL